MYEFKWLLQTPQNEHRVTLQIRSSGSWIARKRLYLNDQVIYRRGWFSGINHTFTLHETQETLSLRATQDPQTGTWHPQLKRAGAIVSELSGTQPPPVPQRTRSVAIVTGVTYLTMLMCLAMAGYIWKILEASLGHSDNRAFVLVVEDGQDPDGVHFQNEPLPKGEVGKPYLANIRIAGGEPPYTLKRTEGRMPPGIRFDAENQEISGLPIEAGDSILGFSATDANNETAKWHYVISVRPLVEPVPHIVTEQLPTALELQEYSASLDAVGGKPPYNWIINKRKLPKGIKVSSKDVIPVPDPTEQVDLPDPNTRPELPLQARAVASLGGTPAPNVRGTVNEINHHKHTLKINGEFVRMPGDQRIYKNDDIVTLEDLSVHDRVEIAGIRDRTHPIRFRVYDSAYSPYQDMAGWIIPFLATAVCLIGFWNMRQWAVVSYGVLILIQALLPWIMDTQSMTMAWSALLDPSHAALMTQAAILLVGIASFPKMRSREIL